MGGSNTITEVCKELSLAGVSHVDIFKEWVTDFADSAGKNAKLKDTWSDADKKKQIPVNVWMAGSQSMTIQMPIAE